MIRFIAISLVVIAVTGCQQSRTIPQPNKSWVYIESDENYAELSLLLSFESEKYGDIGQILLYYKREILPPNVISSSIAMPHMYFGSGDDFDATGSTSVRLKGSSPKVSVSRSFTSDTLEYDINAQFYISYEKTGRVSTNGLTCSWAWTEIKSPNQNMEPMLKTPGE